MNDKAGNRYGNDKEKFIVKSWLDYFIVADIYILGFGMDFSEIDIWWLLCRRLREKSGYGRIIFFEPYDKEKDEKYKVLKKFQVECENMKCNKEGMKNPDYQEFYKKAAEQIKRKMEEKT